MFLEQTSFSQHQFYYIPDNVISDTQSSNPIQHTLTDLTDDNTEKGCKDVRTSIPYVFVMNLTVIASLPGIEVEPKVVCQNKTYMCTNFQLYIIEWEAKEPIWVLQYTVVPKHF